MPVTKLFDQSGTAANQLRSVLRTCERCDGVGLEGIHKPKCNHGEGGGSTYGVSNNENWALQLGVVEGWKTLD